MSIFSLGGHFDYQTSAWDSGIMIWSQIFATESDASSAYQ